MTLVFQPNTALLCSNVSIMDDGILEDNETFSVFLETEDRGVVIPQAAGNANIIITDNDSKPDALNSKLPTHESAT